MTLEKKEIILSGFTSVLQLIFTTISYASVYLCIIAWLGKEQLGIWSIITIVPALAAVLGAGVTGSLIRYIPTYLNSGEWTAIQKLIINGVVFNSILGMVIVVVAYFFAKELLKLMFGIHVVPTYYFELFNYALLTFYINFINMVLLASLDGLQRIPLKNKILIISSLLFSVLGIVLMHAIQLRGLFYAQLIQSVFIFVMTCILLRRIQMLKLNIQHIDRTHQRLFITYGSNLQYISFLNVAFEPATKFFLNRYFGLGMVGTYDLANRVVSQLRMLVVSAIQIISPFVAKRTLASQEEIQHLYRKSFRGSLILSSILFGGLITANYSLLYLFKGLELKNFQTLIFYLCLANVINILSVTSYAISLGQGALKHLTFAQALSTGLNILLFLAVGFYPKPQLAILPTSLAISISSFFVIYYDKHVFNKISDLINAEDLLIYLVSILLPITCLIVSHFFYNLPLLLTIAAFHITLILILMLKNPYLIHIIHVIIRKRTPNA